MGDVSRRQSIRLAGASLVAALAGCSSSGSESTATTTGTAATTRTATSTETTTGQPTSEPTPTESPDVRFVERGDDAVRVRDSESGDVLYSDSDARTAIQHAIDSVIGGGTVRLGAGVFRLHTDPVVVRPGVEFRGAGVGETVLKLADGVNQAARPHVAVPPPATDVTLAAFEVDGNESGNRDVEPFPDHPPAHGILLNGEGTRLENVSVHDTVATNLVVNGTRCKARNLGLRNSAADHWLYVTDAEHCSISGVTAGGFARGSGIVFSVTDRTCRHNTLEDVEISGAATTPMQHRTDGLRGRFPVYALNLRDVGTATGNAVDGLRISNPDHERGHQVFVGQRDARIDGLEYEGPVGAWRTFLRVGSPKRGSPGTEITDVTVTPTALVSDGPSRPSVARSEGSEVSLSGIDARDCDGAGLRGVVFDGQHRPVEDDALVDSTLETDGPVVVADGTDHPVRRLAIEGVEDVSGTGVETAGDVSFERRELD